MFWTFAERGLAINGDEGHLLSKQERLKLAGLRFEKRRSDWLLGRLTAKNLVVKSCPDLGVLDMDAFQVENEASGQPYLVGPDGRRMEGCLSISHREDKAVCALTYQSGAHLGADLEKIEPRDPIFLEDYLGPNESKLALAFEGPGRDFMVTLAWSAKEAAFKAMGTGLRMDTRKIEILGGLEDWSPGSQGHGGWEKIILGGPGLPGPVKAMWQQRNDFVITLVVLGNEPLILHEV